RHEPALDELVEPLEHLVHPLADEGLDALEVDRAALDVAVVELLRAVLEARQARVAVDRRHADPSPQPGFGPTRAESAGGRFWGSRVRGRTTRRSAGGRARAHHTTPGARRAGRGGRGGGKGEAALPCALPPPRARKDPP